MEMSIRIGNDVWWQRMTTDCSMHADKTRDEVVHGMLLRTYVKEMA